MINKTKLVFPMLALGLILSSTAFAAETTTATNGTVNTVTTSKVCMANAKATYTAALKAASDTAKADNTKAKDIRTAAYKAAGVDNNAKVQAIKTANETFQAALKSAKALTDKTAQAEAIKTATATHQTAINAAKANDSTQSSSVKAANGAYKAALIANAKTKAASVKAALSEYKTALKACPKK